MGQLIDRRHGTPPGQVEKTGPIMVHEGERVVPARKAAIRNLLSKGQISEAKGAKSGGPGLNPKKSTRAKADADRCRC